jgi:hypothetical protein
MSHFELATDYVAKTSLAAAFLSTSLYKLHLADVNQILIFVTSCVALVCWAYRAINERNKYKFYKKEREKNQEQK